VLRIVTSSVSAAFFESFVAGDCWSPRRPARHRRGVWHRWRDRGVCLRVRHSLEPRSL